MMKNIIVRLANGIGNQLFTYAAAYSYSKKINANLYVDDESGFYKKCKYELNNFNISGKIVSDNLKFKGHWGRLKRKIYKKVSYIYNVPSFIEEKKDKNKLTKFDENIFNSNVKNTIYFEGYFQSEKYFLNVENELKKEFLFKNELINKKNKFKDLIEKNNSVSIHIRKNRFSIDENHSNLDKLNKMNLKLNIEIAKKGIEYFEKKMNKPKFFIWSNNFDGLNEYFNGDKYVFVDNSEDFNDVYDLYLMTLCNNFILSPSTFHYWGAYLSKFPNKICLSPPDVMNKSGYYGFSNNKDIRANWWI